MALRRVELPPDIAGSLWLGAMPGRFEPWRASLETLQQSGVSLVVCLTPRDEIGRLSPNYHAQIAAQTLPWRWLHLPMENFGLPADLEGFADGITAAAEALRAGEGVLLHCAAGIGRTGSAAACLLKGLGLPTAEALARVQYAGSNPENALQSGLVQRF